MSARVQLSLCLIARDSSRTLGACLQSITPWVDEMIVVDTGSKDDTRQIAASFGARLFEYPWCDDFSAARNESLRHASGTWAFWMDSDDTISPENGRKLRALADDSPDKTCTAFVMQVHCPGPPSSTDVTVVDHVKMFRNDPQLRFEGRIHEQILPAIRRINGSIGWTDIFVTHSGSEHSVEAQHRKRQRDLHLLELELTEKPDHPFVLFNLGMTYADMDESQKAVECLKRCLSVSTPEESHVRKAYALLVGCLVQLDQDFEARRILARGRELFPRDAELWFRLGIIEQRAAKYDCAVDAYQHAIDDREEPYFSSRDHGITGYKARHNLASVYRDAGRLDHAELQWRYALSDQPFYRDGWRGLVESLLDQGRHTTLGVEIELARDRGLPADELAHAAARLAARQGKSEAAIELLEVAISNSPSSLELHRLKCQLLFENGQITEAIPALEELCRRTPGDGAAWHNLATAYQSAGCHNLAISHYQRSLAVRPASVSTLVQLGHAQHAMERFDAARTSWLTAQEFAPDDSTVRAAMALSKEPALAGV